MAPDVEFDLHGLAGVRLVDAAPQDVRAVERQLGPLIRPLGRQPDLTIRFVDRLPVRGTVRYVGPDDAAFTDDAFLVLRSKHKARARVQIPMAALGSPCEIVCETGLPSVPLLIPALNLAVLANGGLALHAAAVEHRGIGAIATGWSKGGKTETLLALADHGARYVADEWAYLSPDGTSVSGVPEPVRVWDWHLHELRDRRRDLDRSTRLRLRSLEAAESLVTRTRARVGSGGRAHQLDRVSHALRRQRFVDLSPRRLFGEHLGTLTTTFDLLLFVESVDRPDTVVEPIDPLEVAARMVASLQYERLPLLGYYRTFQFAFPGARNDLLDRVEALELDRLRAFFGDKPAHLVQHPYPVALADLRPAVQRCFDHHDRDLQQTGRGHA